MERKLVYLCPYSISELCIMQREGLFAKRLNFNSKGVVRIIQGGMLVHVSKFLNLMHIFPRMQSNCMFLIKD